MIDAATFHPVTPSSAAPHHCGKRQQPTASPTPTPHDNHRVTARCFNSRKTSRRRRLSSRVNRPSQAQRGDSCDEDGRCCRTMQANVHPAVTKTPRLTFLASTPNPHSFTSSVRSSREAVRFFRFTSFWLVRWRDIFGLSPVIQGPYRNGPTLNHISPLIAGPKRSRHRGVTSTASRSGHPFSHTLTAFTLPVRNHLEGETL